MLITAYLNTNKDEQEGLGELCYSTDFPARGLKYKTQPFFHRGFHFSISLSLVIKDSASNNTVQTYISQKNIYFKNI